MCTPPQDAGVVVPPIDGAVPPVDAVVVAPDAGIVVVPSNHPRIMLPTQAPRLIAALATSTAAATRWRSTVNSWFGGSDLWGFDAWNGALLSALTKDQKYCVKSVGVIDAQVTAAEVKIAAGAVPEVAGDSYLGVGEMVGDLALVYDWCASTVTAGQRARWINYANQAVWNVWHSSAANWGGPTSPWTGTGGKSAPWSGWATNDPSDNYYYSFLRATMLVGLATKGENPQAETWLTQFHDTKILGQLVPEFNSDLIGGGSREGTGYGVAMRNLFELYLFWQWSTGENLADRTAHTRASLPTLLAGIVPTLDRFAPTGDQSRDSTASLFDYQRAYALELMALYPADAMSARAASLLAASSVPQMQNAFMLAYDFLYGPTMAPAALDLPLVRFAPGIGEIYARTSWQRTATWLNLIAGPYTQSHAHQDQGSLLLYKGTWLAYDAVIASKGGVAQSGSLVGETGAHSLVRIDVAGKTLGQRSGTSADVLALHAAPGLFFTAIDTTRTYASSAVTLVRRQVLWLQPDIVVIQDHVVTSATTSQTWQLAVPTAPVISDSAALVTTGGHTLRASRVSPTAGAWSIFDFRTNSDFTGGWRLDQLQPGGDRTYLTVLSIDGAATAATGNDITMADGSKVTVTFADVGATVVRGSTTTVLTTGVDAL